MQAIDIDVDARRHPRSVVGDGDAMTLVQCEPLSSFDAQAEIRISMRQVEMDAAL